MEPRTKSLILIMVCSLSFVYTLNLPPQVKAEATPTDALSANFETNDGFKIGLNGLQEYYLYDETTQSMQHYDGLAPYWDRGGYGPKHHPTEMLLIPETDIVYSGSQSGRLEVWNTSESGRRFEILHDWDPYVEYLWDVGWFYFPSSIKPLDGMVCFQRDIYERMWVPQGSRPSPTQEFQISLSAATDGRGATLGQQVFTLCLGKGWVDNDNDGTDDMWDYWGVNLYSNRDSHPACPPEWLTQKEGFQVPFDQWFKVEVSVFRNITQQTDEYFNNGYVKVWINDDLIWDVQGTRTVGIAPDIINEIGDVTPPMPQCYLSSGFGLYTAYGSGAKTIYVDDVYLGATYQGDDGDNSQSHVAGSIEVSSDVYYLRGDTATIDVKTEEASVNYTLDVYDPLHQLIYRTNKTTNQGADTVNLPISQTAKSGTYSIEAYTPYSISTIQTSILETSKQSYEATSFPFTRQHNGINFTISARGFHATSLSGEISIEYPDLPISFSVSSFANNMSFVERLKNPELGIYIDLSYLFIYKGIKIVINGTIPEPTSYTFKFSNFKQLVRRLTNLHDGFLVFDWSDIKKVGHACSYDSNTQRLTVSIPKNFTIDPYLFEDGFESGFSTWDGTATTGTCTIGINQTIVHHGSNSCRITSDGGNKTYVYKAVDNMGTNYLRFYFYLEDSGDNDYCYNLASIRYGVDELVAFGLKYVNNNMTMRWMNATNLYEYKYSNTQLGTAQWYCIELYHYKNDTTGAVKVYLDGTEVTDLRVTNRNTTRLLKADYISVGAYSVEGKGIVAFYDCVVFDSSYIGPEVLPTIGEFQAPTTVYANQYFLLNASLNDADGVDHIINATVEISHSVIFKWDNVTATFSIYSDVSGYATIDASSCIETEVNSTAFKLSWNITLDNYPSGSVSIIVTNTKVWETQGSASGSYTGLFTFYYITLVLQGRDASGTKLPRQLTFKGTLGNGTTFEFTSNSSAYYNFITVYGSHTIYTMWGSHLIQTTIQSITSNTTVYINTKIRRLNDGSNYLLFSLNNTDLTAPELVGDADWRMVDVTATGTIQFKMDNLNWKRIDEPNNFIVGTSQFNRGAGSWSFSGNIFTFNCEFSTKTLSMSWPAATSGPSTGSSGGPSAPIGPPTEEAVEPEEAVVAPTAPVTPVVAPSPEIMGGGIGLIILIFAGAIIYGEVEKRKPTPRRAWKKPKSKKVRFPKKKKVRPKFTKRKTKKVNWRRSKEWD